MISGLIIRRLLLAVPTLFGVLLVVFVLLRLAPGDPIAMMIGPGATEQDIAQLRALYGFDQGIAMQFWLFLQSALTGDLGTSISLKRQVTELVAERLPLTIELSMLAVVLAVTMGGGAALIGTYARGSWAEKLLDAVIGTVIAIPDFLWALAGILLFGIVLAVLPAFGLMNGELRFAPASGFYLTEAFLTGRFDVVGSMAVHLLMPALSLALPLAAIIARVLKASLTEVMGQEFILLARARGYSRWRVLLREALRNAAIPALTLTGVQFTFLVGGTVLIEKIFGLPGVGAMAIDAVTNRDLPLIQGVVLTFAVIFIAVNLLVDLVNAALNPRLRGG